MFRDTNPAQAPHAVLASIAAEVHDLAQSMLLNEFRPSAVEINRQLSVIERQITTVSHELFAQEIDHRATIYTGKVKGAVQASVREGAPGGGDLAGGRQGEDERGGVAPVAGAQDIEVEDRTAYTIPPEREQAPATPSPQMIEIDQSVFDRAHALSRRAWPRG